jgi:hypothetical protein
LAVPEVDAREPSRASTPVEQPRDNLRHPEGATYTPFKISDEDIVTGRADAPVTIISYLSPECGHCASWLDQIYRPLLADYMRRGSVRHVLRFVLLTSSSKYPERHAALEDVLRGLKPSSGLSTPEVIDLFRRTVTTREKWMHDPEYLRDLAKSINRQGRKNRMLSGEEREDFSAALVRELSLNLAVSQDKRDIVTFWSANTPTGEPLRGNVPVSFVAYSRLSGSDREVTPIYHVAGSSTGMSRKLFEKIDTTIARAVAEGEER